MAISAKRWGRRVGTAIGWAVLCFGTVHLQPLLNLNPDLVDLLVNKATWIAGLLIIGLSGTDAVQEYVKKNER